MVRNGSDKLRPQTIVDGLRTGNTFAASGQLIDRLAFVACASYPGPATTQQRCGRGDRGHRRDQQHRHRRAGCATMGEKLVVPPGAEIVVAIVVRDPAGTNYSPYTLPEPVAAQIGINQPLNMPVLDHVDLIRGMVTGYKTPGAPDYAGEWPRNTAWLHADGTTADLSVVPAAAKNTQRARSSRRSTAAARRLDDGDLGRRRHDVPDDDFRIPAVTASQYVRLRGTNMPPACRSRPTPTAIRWPTCTPTPNDPTQAAHPVHDGRHQRAGEQRQLSAAATIDGCPDHLPR